MFPSDLLSIAMGLMYLVMFPLSLFASGVFTRPRRVA